MNFGTNLYAWITGQIAPIFLVVLGGAAIWFLVKKETGKFMGFLICAIVVAAFVFQPQWVADLFVRIAQTVFG